MRQKNILLVFTDQQRFDTIEALGNQIIKTPTLNGLVKNGITFTRAYTPCPVCVPARYSMHTGQMPHKTNCVINETMPEGTSFMQILSENGYQTHGVGKMHFTFKDEGFKTMWGFDERDISEEGGAKDDFREYLDDHGYNHVHDPHGVRSDMYYTPQPSQLPGRYHHTSWVVDKSIDFLQNRDLDKPFFLMTSFIKPHPPFESPTPWNKLYRGPEMPLPKRPEDPQKLVTFWNRFQNRYKYRDQGIDDNLVRNIKAAYYGAISYMDYNLSRLITYMKDNKLLENTLIVFTSDHGEMLGDYNCFGKRCFLDSAARIPMIMVHPDLPKAQKCNRPVSLVDILPTFLQYAGIEEKDDYSGKSLTSIAQEELDRDIVYGQYHRDQYALYMGVTEKYKYIYSAPDQKEWLFELERDPQETRNLAYNPMFLSIAEDMKKRIMGYLKNDGCTEPFNGEDWKSYPTQHLQEDPDAYLLFQDPPGSIPHIPGYEREIKYQNDKFFKVGF